MTTVQPPLDQTTSRNIQYLYTEIAFASLLGAVVQSFNSAFAIRLGGSQTLVALLTSIPALVAALLSIPTAQFMQSRKHRRAWMFGVLLVYRIGHGLIALIPLVFGFSGLVVSLISPAGIANDSLRRLFFDDHTAELFVIAVIGLNIPAIMFINPFQAMLGDVIPDHRRPFVISRRAVLWALGIALGSRVIGAFLEHYKDAFPLNYQIIYVIGCLTSLVSSYFLWKIKVPPKYIDRNTDAPGRWKAARPVRTAVKLSAPIKRMLFNTLIYHTGLTIAVPLFNIHYIRTLNATDDWLGFNALAGNLGFVCGNFLWERLSRRYGLGWTLRVATGLTFIFPLGIVLFPNLGAIALLNFLVNLAHPGVDLATFNLMIGMSEPQDRPIIMSWHNTVINTALFVMPLVGAWLASSITIPGVLLIAAVARIIGNLLFQFNRVDTEPAKPSLASNER